MTRKVEAIQWRGKAARKVVTERVYQTSVEDLWDAIVNPDRLQRWFGEVSGDFEEGGHYEIKGNAHGTIETCSPPNRLAITWEFNGGIGWVIVDLKAIDEGRTELHLEHIAHEDEDFLVFWKKFGPGALGVGWDVWLFSLSDYFTTGNEPVSRNEEEWVRTPQGDSFIRTSSDAWMEADITFGTPMIDARDAGKRTYNFFTGKED